MAKRPGKNNIEIERNIIEQYLLTVKDYVKNNRGLVKTVLICIFTLIIVAVSADFYMSHVSAAAKERFDAVLDSYRAKPGDAETIEKNKSELRSLIKDTCFGYVHDMSHYFLAAILFDEKKYDEAYDMYSLFIKKSSSDRLFIPLAVVKSATCLEGLGKTDEAIKLLLRYEEDKDFVVVQDQLIYNSGRLYAKKGDKTKAREYFERLKNDFPQSPYTERAKERLMFIAVQE